MQFFKIKNGIRRISKIHLSRRLRVFAWIIPRSHRAGFFRGSFILWPYTSIANAPSERCSMKSSVMLTENSWEKKITEEEVLPGNLMITYTHQYIPTSWIREMKKKCFSYWTELSSNTRNECSDGLRFLTLTLTINLIF